MRKTGQKTETIPLRIRWKERRGNELGKWYNNNWAHALDMYAMRKYS